MRQKKRKKKKSGPSIPMPPEDKALLDALLEKCKHESPEQILPRISTPALALALAERLPIDDKRSVDLLRSLHNAYDQNTVRKAIRRTAFKLRQNGFDVPSFTLESPGPSFSQGTKIRDEAEAFLGLIDGHGSRGVYLSLPRIPSGYDIGIGLVNDESGIIEFHAASYSKKRMKELKTAVQEEMGVNVPASISHALTVTEDAYEKSLGGSLQVPEDYLSFRSLMLSRWNVLERRPIYDILPDFPDSPEVLTPSQLEKLFSHPAMETWFIDPAEMEPLLLALENLEEGPLLLSEAQQEERIQGIKKKWAEEHFPDARLTILKHRLEEMAYVFHKRDETDYAILALSAACRGLEGDALQGMSPVLAFLLEKTIAHYEELRDEAQGEAEPLKDESPLIIQP
ncbi:MAG: hypothetical protein JRI80_01235 [Deltaproteobacteria bacterium]|nr:hypothetical protein [Deltaproteobacteria bacterium]